MATKRVVVLVSGHGSNLQALLDAAADPAYGSQVVADFPDRERFDLALRDEVAAAQPDAVCLAGFMRILGPAFVRAFPNRIVNTHPSLLPAFRGAHAVPDALSYGVRLTGCTIHLVDEEVDHGPILFQEA